MSKTKRISCQLRQAEHLLKTSRLIRWLGIATEFGVGYEAFDRRIWTRKCALKPGHKILYVCFIKVVTSSPRVLMLVNGVCLWSGLRARSRSALIAKAAVFVTVKCNCRQTLMASVNLAVYFQFHREVKYSTSKIIIDAS